MQMFGGHKSDQHTLTANFYFKILKLAPDLIFLSKNNNKYNHKQCKLVNISLPWGSSNLCDRGGMGVVLCVLTIILRII